MNVWMAVTADKYELPLFIADSAKDLSVIVRVPASTISSAVGHKVKMSRNNMKFVKVEVSDND